MSFTLRLTGYDLSDEGPGRTVNEDATLIREDLGLFALADGAGGRGLGDVAANLALRSVENFIGSTVRRTHDRSDRDVLGNWEQAKRLSAAIHQAHQNIIEIIEADPGRLGMATTIVAALIAPRTQQIHVAHVGDSRCYRVRGGRLERLTVDDTIATDILEMRPETTPEVLERLPRNSVVRALGMGGELRVRISSHDLFVGDIFLLASDGLTRYVSEYTLSEVLGDGDHPSVAASELLNHALAARSQDNISVLVMECGEEAIDEAVDTRRYAEVDDSTRSPAHPKHLDSAPDSANLLSPDIISPDILDLLEPGVEPVEEFDFDSDYPTMPLNRGKAGEADSSDKSAGISMGTYALDAEDLELFEEDVKKD